MSAPHLNRALVLEAPQRVADGAGGFTQSWAALGTLWAEVSFRHGSERAGRSRAAWRIVVRGAPEGSSMRPRVDQRFCEGGRFFRIVAVAERDPGGRYLTCLAEEEMAA